MRPDIKWGDVSYTMYYKDGDVIVRNSVSCFGDLASSPYNELKEISIRRTKCKTTYKYHDDYLQYIADMFNLNAEIGKNSFRFKAFSCNIKNMLVCSTLRFLFEPFCTRDENESIDINEQFLKPLLTGKTRYKDKLKRFCHFYSKIKLKGNYGTFLHTWDPKRTVIVSTQEFVNASRLKNVNTFFYKK